MSRVILIPARLASERLPRKLLLRDTGHPLIEHTYRRCAQVAGVDRLVVAADGPEIVEAVEDFGGEVIETDPGLPSGTDRLAVAASQLGLPEETVIVNVQGDEPEIDPAHVEKLFELLEEASPRRYGVGTLATLRSDSEGWVNPNRVKVVLDRNGRALYFTRAPVPFDREPDSESPRSWLCHLGAYAFRREALDQFRSTRPGELERRERLEQLRFLESGLDIRVGIVSRAVPGIDTEDDYRQFVERWNQEGQAL